MFYYLFDNTNDYLDIPIQAIGTTKKTICYKYNRNNVSQTGVDMIMSSYTDSSNYEYLVITWTGRYLTYKKKSGGGSETEVRSSALPQDDEWHDIIITIDHTDATAANRVKIYVDNVLDTTVLANDDGTAYSGSENYLWGKYSTAYCGVQSFRDIIFMDAIITSDERGYYHNSTYYSISNIILYYKCNEPVPASNKSLTGYTIDYSGNDYHGTPTNVTNSTFFNGEAGLKIPYGTGAFDIDDGDGNTFSPTQIYTEQEKDIVQTDIFVSSFTGTRWGILRKNHKQWIYRVLGITEQNWTDLEALRDAEVTLTPHVDKPEITYTCHLYDLHFTYDKGRYFRESAIIKLTEINSL